MEQTETAWIAELCRVIRDADVHRRNIGRRRGDVVVCRRRAKAEAGRRRGSRAARGCAGIPRDDDGGEGHGGAMSC